VGLYSADGGEMKKERLFGKRFASVCATYLQGVKQLHIAKYLQGVKQLHMCEVPTGC
jgi:hypothetical protein